MTTGETLSNWWLYVGVVARPGRYTHDLAPTAAWSQVYMTWDITHPNPLRDESTDTTNIDIQNQGTIIFI